MTGVVEERQGLLTDPSLWQCDSDEEPTMNTLTGLARNLPSWYIRRPISDSFFGTRYENVFRPVTFESFSSIVSEFLREYECALTELQTSTFAVLATNRDREPETEFCCTQYGCADASVAGDQCGDERAMSFCPEECPMADLLIWHLASRLEPFHSRIGRERDIARRAVEHTLFTLRSYEIEHETLRQLSCFERVSLDLLGQSALLAETLQCLPKIWDTSTSLHDEFPGFP